MAVGDLYPKIKGFPGTSLQFGLPKAAARFAFSWSSLSAARAVAMPDCSGTVMVLDGSGNVFPNANASFGSNLTVVGTTITGAQTVGGDITSTGGATYATFLGVGLATGSIAAIGHIKATAAGNIVLIAQGTTSQSGDLQQWRNVGGTVLAKVNSAGVLTADGSGLTALNASNLSSGTAAVGVGGTGVTSLPIPAQPFRLTTETGVPISPADRTAQSTIYLTQFTGGLVWLYDGTRVVPFVMSADVSLALSGLTSGKPYDVFLFSNSGTLTLEVLVWTNDTTRATALTWQNGLLCKAATPTRLYVGTIYTTSTTATEDSGVKRYVWNYYNRVPRPIQLASTVSGAGQAVTAGAALAQIATEQVNWVCGDAGTPVNVGWNILAANGAVGVSVVGLGIDSTSSATGAGCYGDQHSAGSATHHSRYSGTPGVGRHFLAGLVKCITSNCTYFGANQNVNYGFDGFVLG